MQAGLGVEVLAGEAQVLGDAGVDGRGLPERLGPGPPRHLARRVGRGERRPGRAVVVVEDVPRGDLATPIQRIVVVVRQFREFVELDEAPPDRVTLYKLKQFQIFCTPL